MRFCNFLAAGLTFSGAIVTTAASPSPQALNITKRDDPYTASCTWGFRLWVYRHYTVTLPPTDTRIPKYDMNTMNGNCDQTGMDQDQTMPYITGLDTIKCGRWLPSCKYDPALGVKMTWDMTGCYDDDWKQKLGMDCTKS